MNEFIRFSREAAVKAIGSTWYLDKTRNALCENLGKAIPPSAYSDKVYATFEEAIANHDVPVIALPDDIRVPAGTALQFQSRSIAHFSQFITLMNFQDILGRGLFLEDLPITNVEYDTAPSHLSGRADLVAVYAYTEFQDGVRLRVHIEHDHQGYCFITDTPVINGAAGWVPYEQVLGFTNRMAAEEAADDMARKIINAVNWKANSL